MELELTPLQNAVDQLEKSLIYCHSKQAAKAELIYQGLLIFLASAKVLLKALQRFQNHAH